MRQDDILGYEMKHSFTVPSNLNYEDDLTVIKEIIHGVDGSRTSHLRMIKNHPKPFWIVPEKKRKWKDKRVWIAEEDLKRDETNSRNYSKTIAKKLRFDPKSPMRTLNRSAYLAGTGISTGTWLLYQYRKKWPDLKTANKTAHLDIEAETKGMKTVQMISITMRDRIYQVITKGFLGTEPDAPQRIRDYLFNEVVPEIHKVEKKKLKKEKGTEFKLEIEIVENEWDLVTKVFERLHEWKPDIVSGWNVSYDIERMLISLDRGGIDPKNVFCDPSVPHEFRYFKFVKPQPRPGEKTNFEDLWPKVEAPAHFIFLDQMCTFRRLRLHLSQEPSMKLNDILIKYLGVGKLQSEQEERSSGPDWHNKMQKYHKIFYCVYNIMDNVYAWLLDEYLEDMKYKVEGNKLFTEYGGFGSQGRRLADDYFFHLYEKGKIMTGASDEMVSEIDRRFTLLDDWISTLPSHSVSMDMGATILKEWESLATMVCKWVLDIDVKSSYPSTGYWANIARETTRYILTKIQGVSNADIQRCGVHLTAGRVNATDIICTLTNAPRSIEWGHLWDEAQKDKLNIG